MIIQGRCSSHPTRATKRAIVFSLALAQMTTRVAAIDGSATTTVLINGRVPEGAIVLVCGGLGVAVVALIFVIVQSRLPTSSRKIMDERAKARTDLRLRGGNVATGSSPGVSSSALNTNSRPSDVIPPSVTPVSETSGTGSDTLYKPTRSSKGSPSTVRGYSGSSFSRASMHEMSYSSFSSIRDLNYLASVGRLPSNDASRPSEDNLTKSNRPGSHYLQNQRRHMPKDRPPTSFRPRQSGDLNRSGSQSSLYRGTTDLYLTRTHSGPDRMVLIPTRGAVGGNALVSAANADDFPSYPQNRSHHPLETSHRADSTSDHSRRNSGNALLGDDYTSAAPSTAAPSQKVSTSPYSTGSSSGNSNGLLPATQHPLSTSGQQEMNSVPRPPAISTSPVKQGHYITSNYWKQQQNGQGVPSRSRPMQAPPITTSQSPVYSSAGLGGIAGSPPSSHDHGSVYSFQTSASPTPLLSGHRKADEENLISIHEASQPRHVTQPVSSGNGKRGVPGRAAGSPV